MRLSGYLTLVRQLHPNGVIATRTIPLKRSSEQPTLKPTLLDCLLGRAAEKLVTPVYVQAPSTRRVLDTAVVEPKQDTPKPQRYTPKKAAPLPTIPEDRIYKKPVSRADSHVCRQALNTAFNAHTLVTSKSQLHMVPPLHVHAGLAAMHIENSLLRNVTIEVVDIMCLCGKRPAKLLDFIEKLIEE